MTDPISDMLARIRNAHRALHPSTEIPPSAEGASSKLDRPQPAAQASAAKINDEATRAAFPTFSWIKPFMVFSLVGASPTPFPFWRRAATTWRTLTRGSRSDQVLQER